MASRRQVDPTQTAGLRRKYQAAMGKRFRLLKTALRISIVDNDGLGLETGLRLNAIDFLGVRQLGNLTNQQRAAAFEQWLRTAIEVEILESGVAQLPGLWQQHFIDTAYIKGVNQAVDALNRSGMEIAEQTVSQILNSTFNRTRLEVLYFRNFTELKGVTDSMAQGILRELVDGLSQGKGPRQIASAMAKKVDGIGLQRARVIARTEVIRANNEAQLATFEQFGLDEVMVEAEFLTAGDNRVCPDCAGLEGKIFSIDEASGMIPVHPNCRCSWIPVTERMRQIA